MTFQREINKTLYIFIEIKLYPFYRSGITLPSIFMNSSAMLSPVDFNIFSVFVIDNVTDEWIQVVNVNQDQCLIFRACPLYKGQKPTNILTIDITFIDCINISWRKCNYLDVVCSWEVIEQGTIDVGCGRIKKIYISLGTCHPITTSCVTLHLKQYLPKTVF